LKKKSELFEKELGKRMADMEQNSDKYSMIMKGLREERDTHRITAERIADAIAAAGHSAILLSRLPDAETKMAETQRRIDALKPPDIQACGQRSTGVRHHGFGEGNGRRLVLRSQWRLEVAARKEVCNLNGGQGRNRTSRASLESVTYSVFNVLEIREIQQVQLGSTN